MAEPPVLLQFTASHFNEKARWALDWKGIAHRRRSFLPGTHVPAVYWMTGQRSVPVLVLEGRAIADSTQIIQALEQYQPDPALVPSDPAERRRALDLEEFFDCELGPHIRRALFFEVLDDADYACALFSHDASEIARRAYRTFFPAVRTVMRFDLGIDAERSALSRAKMMAVLDRLEAEIGASGHLVGDRFTVADLTAAALFSPLVQPPEFPYPWPKPPEAALRLRAGFADRPGFRWVEEMYRKHRNHRPVASAAA